jgi:hypothetical protein
VLRRALLEDHGIDAALQQALAEEQAGRAGADDDNLCTHGLQGIL